MLKFFKGFSLKIRSCVNFFHSVNVVYHIHQCVYVEPSLYPIVLVRLLVSMTNTWYLKQFRVRTIYYAISFPSLIPVQSQLDSWLWTYTRQTIAHAGGGGGGSVTKALNEVSGQKGEKGMKKGPRTRHIFSEYIPVDPLPSSRPHFLMFLIPCKVWLPARELIFSMSLWETLHIQAITLTDGGIILLMCCWIWFVSIFLRSFTWIFI